MVVTVMRRNQALSAVHPVLPVPPSHHTATEALLGGLRWELEMTSLERARESHYRWDSFSTARRRLEFARSFLLASARTSRPATSAIPDRRPKNASTE
jgi:hypothetical protein